MPDPLKVVQQLQDRRARRGRQLDIAPLVESIQQRAAQHHRRLGELIELWTDMLPPEITDATSLVGLRGGVLTVAADSSSIAYELDRRLREGLLADLRRRYRGTLTRVKVQVAPAAEGKRRRH